MESTIATIDEACWATPERGVWGAVEGGMGSQKRHEPVPGRRKRPETHPVERTDEPPRPEERMPREDPTRRPDRTAQRELGGSDRAGADGPGSRSGGGRR